MVQAKVVHERMYNPVAGLGFPLIVLVIGLFWLGKDMGWIKTNISFWAVLLIVLGVYWLLKAIMWKRYH